MVQRYNISSKYAQTKSIFAFSQGLLLVFAWRVEDCSLSLRQILIVDYEKVNDEPIQRIPMAMVDLQDHQTATQILLEIQRPPIVITMARL